MSHPPTFIPKFCQVCGQLVTDQNSDCPNCGSKLAINQAIPLGVTQEKSIDKKEPTKDHNAGAGGNKWHQSLSGIIKRLVAVKEKS